MSYVWHFVDDTFIPWRMSHLWTIHCEMTHSYMWHDPCIHVIWPIHTCDMTHSPVNDPSRIYASFFVSRYPLHLCVYIYVNMSIYIQMYTHIYTYTVAYYAHMYTHIYIVHISIRVCIYTHIYIYIYIYICISCVECVNWLRYTYEWVTSHVCRSCSEHTNTSYCRHEYVVLTYGYIYIQQSYWRQHTWPQF